MRRRIVPPQKSSPSAVRDLLEQGDLPPDDDTEHAEGLLAAFQMDADRGRLERAWREYGDEILAAWVIDHPGTRPDGWWQFDSPENRQDHESEAAFLRRHGLTAPGEAGRVRRGGESV